MPADDKLLLATNPVAELSAADAARVLADAAMEAGRLARAMQCKGLKTWIKGKDSPVSEADIAADALLREALSTAAPDYEWLSEESADIAGRPAHRRRWVIDPIDGTRAFIKGQPDWSISTALVENGRPIAAALYAPATEELFVASLGGGATRNGNKIAMTERHALEGARIAGPRFTLERLASDGLDFEAVPRIHSLALRFARAAAGEIDVAFASENSRDWDLAAADLLVHEAGGTLTGAGGRKIIYGDPGTEHPALAAAGRALHPIVIAAFGKVLARPTA
jgi:myo-inositol-1(or 4)-monophosphatase